MNAVTLMSRDRVATTAEAGGWGEPLDTRVRALTHGACATTGTVVPIGRSAAFQDVLRRALQVAATDTNVFLQGESGTGKEVIARFIHQASPRKNGPFVAINCGALPRSLARPVAQLTTDARDALIAHSWPGNVRELHNVLERAAILCEDSLIARQHLLLRARAIPPAPMDLADSERRMIEQVLRETDWNKSQAAKRLGLTRTQLYVRLRRYALDNATNTALRI